MAREMTGVGVNAVVALDDGLDAVGRQHLERGALRPARTAACVSLPM